MRIWGLWWVVKKSANDIVQSNASHIFCVQLHTVSGSDLLISFSRIRKEKWMGRYWLKCLEKNCPLAMLLYVLFFQTIDPCLYLFWKIRFLFLVEYFQWSTALLELMLKYSLASVNSGFKCKQATYYSSHLLPHNHNTTFENKTTWRPLAKDMKEWFPL